MNTEKLNIVFNNLIDILVILYVKNNKKMLSLLLLLPIIGSILLSTIPENSIENKIRMKRITLITMLINFLISIYI
jgi:Na+-transporting methylmalonyl-CoA/oxaloacetate decarboxylase beta subunit